MGFYFPDVPSGFRDASATLSTGVELSDDYSKVWHTTGRLALESIAASGLKTGYSEQSADWIDATRILDSFRPEGLAFSLLDTVFAQPQGPHVLNRTAVQRYGHNVYKSMSRFSFEAHQSKEMLEVVVNPREVYVLPGLTGDMARRLIQYAYLVSDEDFAGYDESFRQVIFNRRDEADIVSESYWSGATLLDDFLDQYSMVEQERVVDGRTFDVVSWVRHSDGFLYDRAPEVLLGPSVGVENIMHVASSFDVHAY